MSHHSVSLDSKALQPRHSILKDENAHWRNFAVVNCEISRHGFLNEERKDGLTSQCSHFVRCIRDNLLEPRVLGSEVEAHASILRTLARESEQNPASISCSCVCRDILDAVLGAGDEILHVMSDASELITVMLVANTGRIVNGMGKRCWSIEVEVQVVVQVLDEAILGLGADDE